MTINTSNSTEECPELFRELQAIHNEISEIKQMLSAAMIRPKTQYLDNVHRDRIIYVLREHLEFQFKQISGILPFFYTDWKFSHNTISDAFYRYREKLENLE